MDLEGDDPRIIADPHVWEGLDRPVSPRKSQPEDPDQSFLQEAFDHADRVNAGQDTYQFCLAILYTTNPDLAILLKDAALLRTTKNDGEDFKGACVIYADFASTPSTKDDQDNFINGLAGCWDLQRELFLNPDKLSDGRGNIRNIERSLNRLQTLFTLRAQQTDMAAVQRTVKFLLPPSLSSGPA